MIGEMGCATESRSLNFSYDSIKCLIKRQQRVSKRVVVSENERGKADSGECQRIQTLHDVQGILFPFFIYLSPKYQVSAGECGRLTFENRWQRYGRNEILNPLWEIRRDRRE